MIGRRNNQLHSFDGGEGPVYDSIQSQVPKLRKDEP
jgi:hypothetical protein